MPLMECESAVKPGASSQKSQSYPRTGRLLRHADFERVYKQGRRHFSAHMTVFYFGRTASLPLPTEPRASGVDQSHAGMRIGFTVSRALGGAVERNRMKRRLREAVRSCWPDSSAAVDIVVNPKKSLLRADFAGLQAEVRRAFEVIELKLAAKAAPRR